MDVGECSGAEIVDGLQEQITACRSISSTSLCVAEVKHCVLVAYTEDTGFLTALERGTLQMMVYDDGSPPCL